MEAIPTVQLFLDSSEALSGGTLEVDISKVKHGFRHRVLLSNAHMKKVDIYFTFLLVLSGFLRTGSHSHLCSSHDLEHYVAYAGLQTMSIILPLFTKC